MDERKPVTIVTNSKVIEEGEIEVMRRPLIGFKFTPTRGQETIFHGDNFPNFFPGPFTILWDILCFRKGEIQRGANS